MEPFVIKDCTLLALATGKRAQNLKELRDGILGIPAGSIYYHFWGNLLQPRFEEREYNNDFASWVRHAVHDDVLGERLAVIDPGDFTDLEALRQELVDVVEDRLDEVATLHWADADQQFGFIHSQIVVFDTHKRVKRPEELAGVVPQLSASSVFYHFIDARRRSAEHIDDFRTWLGGLGAGHEEVIARLGAIDPYFVSLPELRRELCAVLARCYPKVGA